MDNWLCKWSLGLFLDQLFPLVFVNKLVIQFAVKVVVSMASCGLLIDEVCEIDLAPPHHKRENHQPHPP